MGLEYEHNDQGPIVWKFLSKIIIWWPILSKVRPHVKEKWLFLELWCGMAS